MANADSIKRGARFKDITGKPFGRLTVIECVGRNKDGRVLWRCVCECGNERVSSSKDLLRGEVVRCKQCHGRKHGMSDSTEYQIWADMWRRCTNSNCENWELYGGRGIEVCERWQSFEAFFEDMGKRPSKQHSIGRISNDGNYEPGNCRWETPEQQNRNTRRNVMLTYKGETLCMADWAERIGISASCLRKRLNNGWSIERTIETPSSHKAPGQSHASITHNGEIMSLSEWSSRLSIGYYTLLCRMRKGWSVERMLSEPVHS